MKAFYAAHLMRSDGQRIVYLFGGPEAFRNLAEALKDNADDAEMGNRQWCSVAAGTVAFVGCLSEDDAQNEAKSFVDRCAAWRDAAKTRQGT